MVWYEGPTLLEYIESLEIQRNLLDPVLRMSISRVHKIPGVGTVL